jgi:hypothetical protein
MLMSLTSARRALPQRKCACGGTPGPTGECEECRTKKRSGLRTRLKVNELGDPYEQEADRIADQVLATPTHTGSPGTRPRIQRLSDQSSHQIDSAPTSVERALARPGNPLEPALRQDMEQRFGHDFSMVRVHADAAAERSAHDVNAYAFTMGHHIVFASGRFAPRTQEGRRLIAHELTHVVQQGTIGEPGVLQRVPERDAPKAKGWTGAPVDCPSEFCQPLSSEMNAVVRRTKYWPPIKSMIGNFVSHRVVPLWNDWAMGGSSSVRDLSKDFGDDFFQSRTTAKTTEFLLREIKAKLTSSPPNVPTGGSVKLDIPTLIPTAVAAIDNPGGPHEMNFDYPGEIPGNLAGGIGKDQASTPIGANPSPQNDARIAKGDVTVYDAGANLIVLPQLSFTVKDTIDLCPGNCGTEREQAATVPMSRWEATGISGDVPFTVDFIAPFDPAPMYIPKPPHP